MADRFASQTKPSPEGPRPDGINHSSTLKLKSNAIKIGFARTGRVSRNMRKSPFGTFFGLKAAIKTRRYMDAPTDSERISRTVAHILRFKPKCCPNRRIEKRLGCARYAHIILYSEQGIEKYSPKPISARFDRRRKAKKVRFYGLFCMFQLTPPVRAKSILIAFDFSFRVELWFMPSGRGPSGEGNGLSAPPPCCPHRAKILKGFAFQKVCRPPADTISR